MSRKSCSTLSIRTCSNSLILSCVLVKWFHLFGTRSTAAVPKFHCRGHGVFATREPGFPCLGSTRLTSYDHARIPPRKPSPYGHSSKENLPNSPETRYK